jgi:hypothetical protein
MMMMTTVIGLNICCGLETTSLRSSMTWIGHGRMGRRSPSKALVRSKNVAELLLDGEREGMLINLFLN